VVQLLGICTRSDTHNYNRNTGRPHLVRNIPGILGVLRRRLRSVGQQYDDFLCTGACAVGFREEFVLSHAERFIDTCDGTHQGDSVDGLIEVRLVVEIIEGDGEFGVVRERHHTAACSVTDAEVLCYLLEEILLPLVVVSEGTR